MREIHIKSPIWKDRAVGIAEYKITDDILVYVDYTSLDGSKPFPGAYFMEQAKAKSYPLMTVKNVKLRIIPLADFDYVEE